MISEVVGASTIGFVIGYDAQRKFATATLGAFVYVFVSSMALAVVSYMFARTNGMIYSIIAEITAIAGRYVLMRELFRRLTWI